VDERRRGWEATDDSAKINKSNLLNRRDTIMSAYQTAKGTRLWVSTCLDRGGRDELPDLLLVERIFRPSQIEKVAED
jgi:hypothetical protein